MQLQNIHSVYLIGIGGIGMSAIARFFNVQGAHVSGYDRTSTTLCTEMLREGIEIHFEEDNTLISKSFLDTPKDEALVVYTPAVPANHKELIYLREQGYQLLKRAEVLGVIARAYNTIAVAGTHGKTTTSAMIAHILQQSPLGCNAFLGGISTNYNTNLISNPNSKYAVVEADEFDRSFLTLNPDIAVITSVEADHLDVYGEADAVVASFNDFAKCIKKDGMLIRNADIKQLDNSSDCITYSIKKPADLKGVDIHVHQGFYHFNIETYGHSIEGIKLGLPGRHNVENALAAAGVALQLGVEDKVIKDSLASFLGVKRRFETHVHTPQVTYIDDYAHHPTEITACIESVRELYPTKKITGIFQPHLFSRTRDFAQDFARSLSALDQVILLEIYPAREEPIVGINSEMLLGLIDCDNKKLLTKDAVLEEIKSSKPQVLITLGAGDIDQLVEPLIDALQA